MQPGSGLVGTPRSSGLGSGQLAALLYASSLAIVTLNVAPAAEAHLRQDAHLSVAQIGAVYFVELALMGLATLPSYWWLGRIGSARVAQVAYAGFIAGSLLSATTLGSFAPYVFARALTGAAAGTLMILGMTAGARAARAHRVYALVVFAQLASGVLLLAALPALADHGRGLRGLYYLCALLGLAGLLFARSHAPLGRPAPSAPTGTTASRQAAIRSAMPVIALALLFNVVIGGLWAFAAEYAVALSMNPTQTDEILTAATATGLVGAALAYALGERWAGRPVLLAGLSCILVGAALLHRSEDAAQFAAGCHALSFGWNFSLPCLLAMAAGRDRGGRALSSMNLAFAFGWAIGPLAAGTLIAARGLGALFAFVCTGMLVSGVLALCAG
jgi:MFS family permease